MADRDYRWRDERSYRRPGGERDFYRRDEMSDEEMVAYQERLHHRRGGDLKSLHIKGDDEEARHQHDCHRTDEFHGRLFFFFRLF